MRKPKPKEKSKAGRSYRKTKKLNEAYREAVQEIADERIAEVKRMVRQTLEAIRQKDEEIKRLTLERDDFKRDIEDLKRGRIDRIKQRRESSQREVTPSPINPERIRTIFTNTAGALPMGSFTVTNASNSAWANLVDSAAVS